MNEARKAGVIKEAQDPFGKDRFEIKTGEAHKKALNTIQLREIFKYSDGTTPFATVLKRSGTNDLLVVRESRTIQQKKHLRNKS